jgi:hypothetical protein
MKQGITVSIEKELLRKGKLPAAKMTVGLDGAFFDLPMIPSRLL